MFRIGLLGALVLSGCGFLDRGACDSLATEICDACDVTEYTEDTMCACLADGEVENASKYFPNKDSAEQWCYRLQQDVKATYNTDETVKQCKADLDYIKEYEDDACVDLGYEAEESNEWDTGW